MRKDIEAAVAVVCVCVCVARVKSKSFVVHKSADIGSDVRTNRAALCCSWPERGRNRREDYREGRESRTAAVRTPSHTCHTGSEHWPLFPGYTSSNTAQSRDGGGTSAVREKQTGGQLSTRKSGRYRHLVQMKSNRQRT